MKRAKPSSLLATVLTLMSSSNWAVVLDGEIEMTIGGVKNVFKKGDTYFVEKGIKHSAKIKKGYTDLTLFNQPDRYKVKK